MSCKKKSFLECEFVEHPVNFLFIAFDYYIKKFKSINWVSAKLGVYAVDWSLIDKIFFKYFDRSLVVK